MDEKVCIACKRPFTTKNVHSKAGWAEVKISQMCEDCFDEATEEPEEDELHEYQQGKLDGAKAERERIWEDLGRLFIGPPPYIIHEYADNIERIIFGGEGKG